MREEEDFQCFAAQQKTSPSLVAYNTPENCCKIDNHTINNNNNRISSCTMKNYYQGSSSRGLVSFVLSLWLFLGCWVQQGKAVELLGGSDNGGVDTATSTTTEAASSKLSPPENNNGSENHFIKELIKNHQNLHMTSLLQDDLSYLEDAMEEKYQNEILERIIFGEKIMLEDENNDGGNLKVSQRRHLQDNEDNDDEDDEEVDRPPPKCIAPPSTSSSRPEDMINSNTTNTTTTPGNAPERANFSGILLLQCVGRPTAVSENETEIIAKAILAIYQKFSECSQPGVVRNVNRVEIIRDVFGLENNNNGGDSDDDDDGMIMGNETNSTMARRRHRHRQLLHAQSQFIWNQDDENHILWKTSNEYFEWNLRHQPQQQQQNSHFDSHSRFLQQGNNNTGGNNTGNIAILIPVTQPFNWLARLTGTCNGCALQPTLFDDITRRRLVSDRDNENKKNNMLSPQIRGGAGGNGGGIHRSLMDPNTTEPSEICNCPGPKPGLFRMALNDTVRQLVQEGLLQSFDAIEETPELVRTSSTSCNDDDEDPMMETFSATVNLTLKACPSQFIVRDDEGSPTFRRGLSPLEVLALAYQKTFNELNLLNGGRNCDPYARRLVDATATIVTEELQVDENCTAANSPFLSFQLELEAECIGCNATLFELEEEEDPEESDGDTRFLRKLQQDPPGRNSDLFPFCFCPAGTPSRGITATELLQAFNVTLDIFEREGRGGNEFIVELEEIVVLPPEGTATCGNGIMELGEECDDGNDVDTDDCNNACLEVVNATSLSPTSSPSDGPTPVPTDTPSTVPTTSPSTPPSSSPSTVPSTSPSIPPSSSPSTSPSSSPSTSPSSFPSSPPSNTPSYSPSSGPSGHPSPTPSDTPSKSPTPFPSRFPSSSPNPSHSPSNTPSDTLSPSKFPSSSPTTPPPTTNPSDSPSNSPSSNPPSNQPTRNNCDNFSEFFNLCGQRASCVATWQTSNYDWLIENDPNSEYGCKCNSGFKYELIGDRKSCCPVCPSDATCQIVNNIPKCVCDDGRIGNGVTWCASDASQTSCDGECLVTAGQVCGTPPVYSTGSCYGYRNDTDSTERQCCQMSCDTTFSNPAHICNDLIA